MKLNLNCLFMDGCLKLKSGRNMLIQKDGFIDHLTLLIGIFYLELFFFLVFVLMISATMSKHCCLGQCSFS